MKTKLQSIRSEEEHARLPFLLGGCGKRRAEQVVRLQASPKWCILPVRMQILF